LKKKKKQQLKDLNYEKFLKHVENIKLKRKENERLDSLKVKLRLIIQTLMNLECFLTMKEMLIQQFGHFGKCQDSGEILLILKTFDQKR
jgi:hypothetical protein